MRYRTEKTCAALPLGGAIAPIFTVLATLLVAFAGSSQTALAFVPATEHWDHSCFTTDGNPEIVAALAKWASVSGVTDCGVSDHPDISAPKTTPALLAGLEATLNLAFASKLLADSPTRLMDRCEIAIRPTVDHDQWLWLHEVGHCLLLEHSDVAGAVMWAGAGDRPMMPQPDDIAGAQSIYGPARLAFRYRAAALSSDD